ncbi:MAG: dTMP kinase [Bacteroidetes bacterium RIFOXYA12_FULL_35_11]|nr:MAG: dTMP kinase [Bacteroidetes bacterium GWF2_35_48]OFY74118.1 MAG: dTMP kinase [Bacteroidetes bacterium RIFOXYA12_FULL_35_11]OFY93311.1 MAG: dTMP kinase [Bacteroidetes bacterium RIFOXYB2_FULL_35_7]OFY96865.1 MAG: dTMP kinase [Bacteroidetes bacterium RIFOXYC12_FULL_35_7]HBX53083.1 dTMP kinase [Bacteroidales bacterium]
MKLLVIEGLDGSGKSTQIDLLQNFLTKNKVPYKYLHFPRTDAPFFGELVSMFLRGDLGDLANVNPYLVALIYAGDRNDAKEMILQWLKEDHLVLLDRYVHSNIAFQCAKLKDKSEQEKLKDFIIRLEYEYYKIPKPDLNIFLSVPFSFTENKLSSQRSGEDRSYLQGKKDIHEQDLEFQKNVREMYLNSVKDDPNFRLIDCTDGDTSMLPPDKIFEKIIYSLKDNNMIP